MPKQIAYNQEARDGLKNGIDMLAKAVMATLDCIRGLTNEYQTHAKKMMSA